MGPRHLSISGNVSEVMLRSSFSAVVADAPRVLARGVQLRTSETPPDSRLERRIEDIRELLDLATTGFSANLAETTSVDALRGRVGDDDACECRVLECSLMVIGVIIQRWRCRAVCC